jgi:RimJ/RimL family protein N-acetyltransferase
MVAMSGVSLRAIGDGDLDALFEQMRDPEAVRMAAFTHQDPDDRALFDAQMARIGADPTTTNRVIIRDGQVAGMVASFQLQGETEVTYWVDRSLWGQGVATEALRLLLDEVKVRPVHARAASDNLGSLRVLEKAGFRIIGTNRDFAQARNAEIEETIFRLD